ncbi:hypothetical protein FB451DRAFT_1038795 [Mycena latifolia]|nr:hypothetical protein FB451DRAFT_1038795 [Mycena latifolia]
MTVGGMTQYLTSVQGMPKEIEEYLDKRIKTFMWEGRAIAPINKDILHLPVEEGGKNLLSIRDRNDAIKIKTLQSYLTRDENRGKWCDLADQSFRKSVPEGRLVEKRARISPFTQTWSPLQRKLPRALKQMIKTAAKFQLKFDALSLAKDVKEELPVWFNIGGKKDLNRHNNSNCAKCHLYSPLNTSS